MGAIDFIVSGDSDALKAKKGLLLAPLDVGDSLDDNAMITDAPPLPREDNSAVQEIEDCCVEWRAGLVKAEWIALTDPKLHDSKSSSSVVEPTAYNKFRVRYGTQNSLNSPFVSRILVRYSLR